MIFYFTGTGNSYHAAKAIAQAVGEEPIKIANELDRFGNPFSYELKENDIFGFVFPVYAWGPPRMVLDFVRKLTTTGGKPYVFSLCTCGDEEGRTTSMLQKALNKRGLSLDSAFTLQMPNNYIIGFDVDAKELEAKKLKSSDEKLKKIIAWIRNRRIGVFDLLPGKLAYIKSTIVHPLFRRFAANTKKFYTTKDCTRCGLCETICPLRTIKVNDKPVWGKHCTQCLACLHRCPARAIQYGKSTQQKGRYVHPDLRGE